MKIYNKLQEILHIIKKYPIESCLLFIKIIMLGIIIRIIMVMTEIIEVLNG